MLSDTGRLTYTFSTCHPPSTPELLRLRRLELAAATLIGLAALVVEKLPQLGYAVLLGQRGDVDTRLHGAQDVPTLALAPPLDCDARVLLQHLLVPDLIILAPVGGDVAVEYAAAEVERDPACALALVKQLFAGN